MQATYDKDADALSVTLLEAERARTVQVAPGVLVHFDREQRVIELEVLGASGRYPPAVLEQLSSPAEWLTLADAAKEFGLSASTLRNQVLNKKIPATKSGRDWLVTRAAMTTYLDNRAPSGRQARKKKARRPVIDLVDAAKKMLTAPRRPRARASRRGKAKSA